MEEVAGTLELEVAQFRFAEDEIVKNQSVNHRIIKASEAEHGQVECWGFKPAAPP